MDTPRFSLRVEVGDEWGEGSMRNKASRSQGFQRAAPRERWAEEGTCPSNTNTALAGPSPAA